MSQHELLRERIEQHKIKNILSRQDDKNMKKCAKATVELLQELLPQHNFSVEWSLPFTKIADYCGIEIADDFKDRKILPDAA